MEEKTYTRYEIQELLEPLMKQIEFYNKQNIQLKTYIRKQWIPFGDKTKFLREIRILEDESDTIIFNLVNLPKSNLEMLKFYTDSIPMND